MSLRGGCTSRRSNLLVEQGIASGEYALAMTDIENRQPK
jgi:hypothetical protein